MAEGIAAVTKSIVDARGRAICVYLTAGYPDRDRFTRILPEVASACDVIEIGVPFTDPMADGLSIQRASQVALSQGVTLGWAIETVADLELSTPWLMMGYFNPFHAYGLGRLVDDLAQAGAAGLIVPDLPMEEGGEVMGALEGRGLGLVQLVAPTTPEHRLRAVAAASRGFVYAVTVTGVTGGSTSFDQDALVYLDRVKGASDLPVLAGFGVRQRSQVSQLVGHVDGVVVGSALIECIDDGADPAAFLHDLRPA